MKTSNKLESHGRQEIKHVNQKAFGKGNILECGDHSQLKLIGKVHGGCLVGCLVGRVYGRMVCSLVRLLVGR